MISDATAPRREGPAAADLLSLAAAPIFAVMALATAIHDGVAPAILCSAANDAWPLMGMVPMYALMSAFHAPPWMRLIARWRTGG